MNPSLVRHNNYRSILQVIRSLKTCTVSQIAEQLPLSKTAIAKGVTFLSDLGFLVSIGKDASSAVGGKPAELYTQDTKLVKSRGVPPSPIRFDFKPSSQVFTQFSLFSCSVFGF